MISEAQKQAQYRWRSKAKRIEVVLPAETVNHLDSLVKAEGKSRAELIRQWIESAGLPTAESVPVDMPDSDYQQWAAMQEAREAEQEQPLPVTPARPEKAPPKPDKPGKLTTKPGAKEYETEVWRGDKQLGSIYKRREGYPRPKMHYEVFKYGHILPSGKYRTKKEAMDALKG